VRALLAGVLAIAAPLAAAPAARPAVDLAPLAAVRLAPSQQAGPVATADVARAALACVRAGQLPRARVALTTLLAGQQPDGLFPDALPAGEEVALRLTGATGRAGWALAEAAARLAPGDPPYAARLRAAALRALGDPAAQEGATTEALACAALGLAALVEAAPDAGAQAALGAAADRLAAGRQGDAATWPYNAHRPRAEAPPAGRRLWVTPQPATVAALAAAGAALARPELVRAAQAEADHFGVHALLAGGPATGFSPGPSAAAHGPAAVAAWVEGLTRLWRRTRDPRYAQTAGLWAGWLEAGQGPKSAGVDAVLTRLALQDVPLAWAWRDARPVGPVQAGPSWLAAAPGPPARPSAAPPHGAGVDVLRRAALGVPALDATFTAPAGLPPVLVLPVLAPAGLPSVSLPPAEAAAGAGEPLVVTAGGQTWATGPAARHRAGPRPMQGSPVVTLAAGASIRVTSAAAPGTPLQLDGVLLQPAIAARTWRAGTQRLTIARNYTAAARAYAPGRGWSTMIGPHAAIWVVE